MKQYRGKVLEILMIALIMVLSGKITVSAVQKDPNDVAALQEIVDTVEYAAHSSKLPTNFDERPYYEWNVKTGRIRTICWKNQKILENWI